MIQHTNNITKIFTLNSDSSLFCTDTELMYKILCKIKDQDYKSELLNSLHEGSGARYKELIENTMVKIPGGNFFIGSEDTDVYRYLGESPRCLLNVSTFYLSSTTITSEKFYTFMPQKKQLQQNKPATFVSWYDAYFFSHWVGSTLPTETQWEYACKGGDENNTLNKEDLLKIAWFSENSNGSLQEVAQLEPNNYGLYDMLGNVWEWCLDYYDEYSYSNFKTSNPVNKNRQYYRVNRGGSIHAFTELCRASQRYSDPPSYKAIDLGFRVARKGDEI